MHRDRFLLFCQAMSLVALLCSIAGCIGDKNGSLVQDDLNLTSTKQDQDTITIVTVSENTLDEQTVNPLSGTCPKGQHCGSPSCPLWADLNSNSLCDRGE